MTLEDFLNTFIKFMLLAIMALICPNMTRSEILTLVTWVTIALSQWNIDGLQIIAGLVFICVLDWIQSGRMHVRIEHEETGNPVEHAETPTVEPPTLVQPFQESFPPLDNGVNARMPINRQTEATLLREHHQRREQLKRERDEEDLLKRQQNQEKRETEHKVQWKRLERFRKQNDQEQRLLQQKKRQADDEEERKQLTIQRELWHKEQQQQLAWEREQMNREKLKMQDTKSKEDVPRQPEDSLTKDQGQAVQQKVQVQSDKRHGIQGANCHVNQVCCKPQVLKQSAHVNGEKQGLVAIREERLEIPNIPHAVSDEQSLPSDVQDNYGPADEDGSIARQEEENPEENPKIRDDSDISSDDTEATVLHPD